MFWYTNWQVSKHPNTCRMKNESLYFLKMSGFLEEGKQNEFQQTVQFVCNHLPPECLGYHLAIDVNEPGLYHFYLLWSSKDALKNFKESREFDLLKGAYKTLGSFKDAMSGKKSDLALFDLNFFDSNSIEP